MAAGELALGGDALGLDDPKAVRLVLRLTVEVEALDDEMGMYARACSSSVRPKLIVIPSCTRTSRLSKRSFARSFVMPSITIMGGCCCW